MSSGATTCFPHLMTKKMWMTYEREQMTEEREEKKEDKLCSPFFFRSICCQCDSRQEFCRIKSVIFFFAKIDLVSILNFSTIENKQLVQRSVHLHFLLSFYMPI